MTNGQRSTRGLTRRWQYGPVCPDCGERTHISIWSVRYGDPLQRPGEGACWVCVKGDCCGAVAIDSRPFPCYYISSERERINATTKGNSYAPAGESPALFD